MKRETSQDDSDSLSEDSTEQAKEQQGGYHQQRKHDGGHEDDVEQECDEGDINAVREAYRKMKQRLELKKQEGAAKDKAIELLTNKNKFYEKKLNQMEESVQKFEIILKTLAMDQPSFPEKTLSFQPYRPYEGYATKSRPSYGTAYANGGNGSYTYKPEGLQLCCKCRGASAKMAGNMNMGVRGGRSSLGGMDQYRRERIMSMNTTDGVLRIQGLYH